MDRYGMVYKTTNLANEKIYIGQTINKDKYYLGSGKIIKLAFDKYGRKSFKRENLCFCFNRKELNLKEIYWIAYYRNINIDNIYNITDGGGGKSGYTMSEETKRKIILIMAKNIQKKLKEK